jgi:choline dehydrogenase-like flavoprotein
MPVEPSEQQVEVLRAICDTFVPSVSHTPDPHGFWARSATDMGADQAILQLLTTLPDDQQAGMLGLLDAIAGQGFVGASPASREQLLKTTSLANRDAAGGIATLGGLTLLITYAGADPETGQNPNWPVFGFPGPVSAPPPEPKTLTPLAIDGDTTLQADAVIVGSGAGGGVIAAELATAGLRVVILEAGGYFNEADFVQSELWAYQNLFWRGGPQMSGDMNISIQAGGCLGGGTVVNWTNSLKTKPWVREQWAREHGLEDVGSEEWERHIDAVWQRLGVNDDCSDLNVPHQLMQAGAEALGWNFKKTTRNTDPERYDPDSAGYMGFGDQSGAKNSTMRTYLQDAQDHGAQIVTRAFALKVLTDNGRAAGVFAVHTNPDTGVTANVTVSAPHVVVAAGALESPALLLRSEIGGPAAGKHLRLHPCTATMGTYPQETRPWWGPPHPALVDEFAAGQDDDGYGFLIEGVQYTTGIGASAIPWTSGEQHKAALEDFGHVATFIGLVRDHGEGEVVLDEQTAMGVPYYALTDPVDVATTRRALEAQIRLHHAAGAQRIGVLATGLPTWHRGEDDLEAFIARAQKIPLRAGAMRMFAAHQMGTCRMGTDPSDSVANPHGELHDTPGVWIGDASAFPTPSGTNPMITIMALAHRTAERIRAAAGAKEPGALQEA